METVLRETRLIAGLALLAPVVFVIHGIEEAPAFGRGSSCDLLGALPMAAHGYLIVFRGSRLF